MKQVQSLPGAAGNQAWKIESQCITTSCSERRAWKLMGTEAGSQRLGRMLRKGLAQEEACRLTPEGKEVPHTGRGLHTLQAAAPRGERAEEWKKQKNSVG